MKILVIGKSAATHAFVQLLSKSSCVEKIWCVPGNPAIAAYADCVNISLDDITAMVEFAKEKEVDITIPTEEFIIKNGIADIFVQENLKIFAPLQEAAQIATNRAYSKKVFSKYKIPILKNGVFDREASAIEHLKKIKFPAVVKYDYHSHNDMFLCSSYLEAKNTVEKAFFQVGKKVILEEFSEGEIIRLSVLTDGYNVIPFPYVKEYERMTEGEFISQGVGAYSPAYRVSSKTENKIAQKILFPILDAMQDVGTFYVGFLSMKFLITPSDDVFMLDCYPFPDNSEATCIFQMIDEDIVPILQAALSGDIERFSCFNVIDDFVASVCFMSGDYPLDYKDKSSVKGIESIDEDNIELYYDNVGMNSMYEISTTGGSAFFMTSKAATLSKALQDLYNNVDTINFEGIRYSKDIGKLSEKLYL